MRDLFALLVPLAVISKASVCSCTSPSPHLPFVIGNEHLSSNELLSDAGDVVLPHAVAVARRPSAHGNRSIMNTVLGGSVLIAILFLVTRCLAAFSAFSSSWFSDGRRLAEGGSCGEVSGIICYSFSS